MKIPNQKQLSKTGDTLYKKFGKPLEKDHWGEYVAISRDGKTVLGSDLKDVFQKSLEVLGSGSYLFKVGERAIYKWCNLGY